MLLRDSAGSGRRCPTLWWLQEFRSSSSATVTSEVHVKGCFSWKFLGNNLCIFHCFKSGPCLSLISFCGQRVSMSWVAYSRVYELSRFSPVKSWSIWPLMEKMETWITFGKEGDGVGVVAISVDHSRRCRASWFVWLPQTLPSCSLFHVATRWISLKRVIYDIALKKNAQSPQRLLDSPVISKPLFKTILVYSWRFTPQLSWTVKLSCGK